MSKAKTLEQLAADRGLQIKRLSDSHVQIVGGACLVNYYPESKMRRAFICGQVGKARTRVTPEQAIEMAFEPIPEGWRPKNSIQLDKPRERSPEDWAALLPHLKFAWRKIGYGQKSTRARSHS